MSHPDRFDPREAPAGFRAVWFEQGKGNICSMCEMDRRKCEGTTETPRCLARHRNDRCSVYFIKEKPECSVKDMLALKTRTERDIASCISEKLSEFETTTGLSIAGLNFELSTLRASRGEQSTHIMGVSLKINL